MASSVQRSAADVESPMMVTVVVEGPVGSGPRRPSWRPTMGLTTPSPYSPRESWNARTAAEEVES